jgi:methionyl-tRNA formyltransferase
MKIGYFGSPQHSAQLLQSLIDEGFPVSFVVTNPDKPKGRTQNLSPTPVKEVALKHSIPVLQYPSIKTPEAISEILQYESDINIVFAYGSIIPTEIFSKPPLGTVNLHGSLLPQFRGASPVQAALLAGLSETGFTIQYITKDLDAGDIVSMEKIPISIEDTFTTLLEKITVAGTTEIVRLLKTAPADKFPATPQDHSKATKCGKIKPEDRPLVFTRPALELHNKVRAFNPDPLCFFQFRGRRVLVHSTKVLSEMSFEPTGSVVLLDKKTIAICCGDGKLLALLAIQPESKKLMTATDFINGFKPQTGEYVT